MAFTENALFKSSGTIYLSLPSFWLVGELLMDKGAAMASFQLDMYLRLAMDPTRRLVHY